ncbi:MULTISPECIES: hypothetical protein [unclassified Bradyrhizobium]|uniref:hypothetical protein n=1 Tax=unclassified Bradyrhizobium TaxID=2631580 RepID=UPI002916B30A|nr:MULTISPECIES: hypothetical protein [unclassified Bradyrhizobium]
MVYEHFIGTRAAFGAFHADTVVVDSMGARRTVSSLCEMEDPWSLAWESCVHGGDLMRLESGIDQLWDAFATLALAGNGDVMVVKRFHSGLTGKKRFARVVRSDLGGFLTTGAPGVVAQIKSLLLTDPDLACADRAAYRLAMWLVTSLQATGNDYRLNYDALQHTCSVNVRLDSNVGQIESLRTAFVAGIAGRATIDWADRTWNPVSSGFILDGSSA